MPTKTQSAVCHNDPRPLVERTLAKDSKSGKVTRSVTVNLAESPLSWLHARGHLTNRQFLAGEKLRETYETACIGQRITMRWEDMSLSRTKRPVPAPMEAGEKMLSAKERFDDAMTLLGQGLADISWRVICAGEGVPIAEKGLGWPSRSGKLVLSLALDRLADHYRIGA